jgi:hypothetical protein
MTRRPGFLASLAILAAGLATQFLAAGHAPARAVPAAAPLFTAEKGRFRILVGGRMAAKEEFEIAPDGDNWVARGSTEVAGPQGTTHVSATLKLHADGTPVRYEWTTQAAKKNSATVEFEGTTATIELRLEGSRPFTQQLTFTSPRVVVLDNNLYHQYALLARMYDWDKKGAQAFPVLIPQEMTPGSVTVEALGPQEIGGAKLEELRVRSEDLEIDLYLDGRRLVRVVAPASNAEAVRE